MLNYEYFKSKPLGAFPHLKGTHFRVWAQNAKLSVELLLHRKGQATRKLKMKEEGRGYFILDVPEARGGERYFYSIDGKDPVPDPCSRYQPEGSFGPSEVFEESFPWSDQNWSGIERSQLTLYELHVGAFSKEGTFESAIEHLPRLRELGINAIEVMPVAQFSGKRNWGYDGVFPFATQNSYGGPKAFKEFINACHLQGIAVILDVVYNHLGPEGNVLSQYGPYFQDRYHTPWGEALNYDGAHSDEVKNYFCQNALQWLEEFHIDGLRLDAVHAICDWSQKPFLEILADLKLEVEKRRHLPLHLIAESDLNDPRVLQTSSRGGFGIDLQWNDDFHHSLHVELTKERTGYYQDFSGVNDLVQSFKQSTVYRGQYSVNRKRSHGREFVNFEKERFVVYSQNHDQIGNRPLGDRLVSQVGLKKQKLAAACVFLSPFTPLIFMGEEIGETAPFCYFVDHQNPELIEAVRKGRKEEFRDFFESRSHEAAALPDPAHPETFQRCIVQHDSLTSQQSNTFSYYQKLIQLSKWIRKEKIFDSENVRSLTSPNSPLVLELAGSNSRTSLWALFSFQEDESTVELTPLTPGSFKNLKVIFHSDPFQEGKIFHFGQKIQLPGFSAVLIQGIQEDL